MPDLGTTYSPDPEALVELCLRIAGESPDVLDDRVLDDANDPLVFSYLEEDNETGLEQDQGIHIEPSLQDWVAHDVQRLAELEEDKKRLNEALASDPDLQDKVTVVIDQRLENLGFREADLRGVPPGVRRVVFLHRAQNGIERPLHLADPLKAETFVIEVACVYTAVYNSFKVRTLHFPTSMRWPQFHERLKQHTTNWQTLGMEDCSEGLTPANGPWRYTLNRQSKGVESIAEWIVVSDEESLRTMKRCLVDSGGDGNQKTAFLIHDKLKQYSEAAKAEHDELCDRTGGSGEDAISSVTGYPFEKTFNLQECLDIAYDFIHNGVPELDRRDSKAEGS